MCSAVQPVLYSFWRSSCAWRVRIALNLKEISYDIKPVDLLKLGGKGHTDEFQKINPLVKVPALQIDGHTLVESIAIMEYLEETRPKPQPLLPQDPYKRCKVREISEIFVSGIQPLQNLGLLSYIDDEKRLDWAQQWIARGFNGIEQLLSISARKYCVGDEISMADCCLVPQVFNAQTYFKVDLTPYPIISRIYGELEKHPSVCATHPSTQLGYPTETDK